MQRPHVLFDLKTPGWVAARLAEHLWALAAALVAAAAVWLRKPPH